MINKFEGEYRYLSNFGIYPVVYEGIDYPTSEHAYQAAKTLDMNERKFIANLSTPAMSKKFGKRINLRTDWNEVKLKVMEDIVRNKFNDPRNTDIKQKLIDTGNEELVEGNWWGDVFWGVCKGIGENNLGKILMKVRDELKS